MKFLKNNYLWLSLFCFYLQPLQAQVEIRPTIGYIEGKPNFKISKIVLDKHKTTIVLEADSARKFPNAFFINEQGSRQNIGISEKISGDSYNKGAKYVSIVFSPIHADTKTIDLFEDVEGGAMIHDIEVFNFNYLLINPTPVSEYKGVNTDDYTNQFKNYFKINEKDLKLPEGLWDLKLIAQSIKSINSSEFGVLYGEKTNTTGQKIAIVQDKEKRGFMMLRMDGALLNFYISPTSDKFVYSLKKSGSEYFVPITFQNPFFATIESFRAKDFSNDTKPEDQLELLKIELSKTYPGEGIGNFKRSGTGFLVSPDGTIATNYHVIEDGQSISVTFFIKGEAKSYPASVLYSDKNNDLALIKITDPAFKSEPLPYFIQSGSVDVGSQVFTLGYPLTNYLGNEIKYSDGKISSKSGFKGDISTYQISVPLQPGNSGGPLFDEKGGIVGITNAKFSESDNISYAIKSDYLLKLIELIPNSNKASNINLQKKTLPEKIKILSDYVAFIKVQ